MKHPDRHGNLSFAFRAPGGRVLEPDELPLVRAFDSNERIVGEELELDAAGRTIPVLVAALPVRAPTGRLCGVTMTIEDITERRRQERLRDEWSAIIAHDLRQPVSAIALASERLMKLHEHDPSDSERRIIERVVRASGHLDRMISDLMDASLIESDRLSLRRRLVDAGALVAAIVESAGATADREIRVRPDGAHEAWLDEDRIRQVLGNLLSNAQKYGTPGTPIDIELARRDDEIEIVVSNEGPGIPADRLPLLFSRFERARETRTPGLGLGLYITKGLVDAHGGRIWAESTPGRTTSFHVVLPKHPPPSATEGHTVH
jgi:signal transduction histidine kinase